MGYSLTLMPFVSIDFDDADEPISISIDWCDTLQEFGWDDQAADEISGDDVRYRAGAYAIDHMIDLPGDLPLVVVRGRWAPPRAGWQISDWYRDRIGLPIDPTATVSFG